MKNEPQAMHTRLRCHARTRRGKDCPNFARANGRCRRHGGLSTGPKTPEGLQRSQQARLTHGFYSVSMQALQQAFQSLYNSAVKLNG